MSEKMQIPVIIRLDDRLANGRGMTDCELVGIMGWCGEDCHVLKQGECEAIDDETPPQKD